MANWSNPQLTSTYTNFVTEVKDRDVDLALQFDGTTSTNLPTNAIRWNSSINRWQKWSGSAWGELTSTYALNALSVSGATSLATATATTPTTGDNSTNLATTAWVRLQNYVTGTGSFLPLTGGTISGNLSVTGSTDLAGNLTVSNINGGPIALKNKVINGDFLVDQYNAGQLVNPTSSTVYPIDRWVATTTGSISFQFQRNMDSVTPPDFFQSYGGIKNNTAVTISSTDNASLQQRIDGANVSNWRWGTSVARDTILSFWARSSLTGTFTVSVQNTANDRSYVATYTITTANTWQYKTISIPADTTGTWFRESGIGIRLRFNLAAGNTLQTASPNTWLAGNFHATSSTVNLAATANATFFITGVQMEDAEATGSRATQFEDLPFALRLIQCQRYFCKTFDYTARPAQNLGRNGAVVAASSGASLLRAMWQFPVEMRAAPTITTFNPNAANANWRSDSVSGDPVPATPLATGTRSTDLGSTSATVLANNTYLIHATASAEL